MEYYTQSVEINEVKAQDVDVLGPFYDVTETVVTSGESEEEEWVVSEVSEDQVNWTVSDTKKVKEAKHKRRRTTRTVVTRYEYGHEQSGRSSSGETLSEDYTSIDSVSSTGKSNSNEIPENNYYETRHNSPKTLELKTTSSHSVTEDQVDCFSDQDQEDVNRLDISGRLFEDRTKISNVTLSDIREHVNKKWDDTFSKENTIQYIVKVSSEETETISADTEESERDSSVQNEDNIQNTPTDSQSNNEGQYQTSAMPLYRTPDQTGGANYAEQEAETREDTFGEQGDNQVQTYEQQDDQDMGVSNEANNSQDPDILLIETIQKSEKSATLMGDMPNETTDELPVSNSIEDQNTNYDLTIPLVGIQNTDACELQPNDEDSTNAVHQINNAQELELNKESDAIDSIQNSECQTTHETTDMKISLNYTDVHIPESPKETRGDERSENSGDGSAEASQSINQFIWTDESFKVAQEAQLFEAKSTTETGEHTEGKAITLFMSTDDSSNVAQDAHGSKKKKVPTATLR